MNIVVGIQRPKYMYLLEFYFMEKNEPITDHCGDIDIYDTDSNVIPSSIFFSQKKNAYRSRNTFQLNDIISELRIY